MERRIVDRKKIENELKKAGVKYEVVQLPIEVGNNPDLRVHAQFHKRELKYMIATLVYKTEKGLIAVQKRGDCKIKSAKLKKQLGIQDLSMVSAEELMGLGFIPGHVPALDLNIPVYIDRNIGELEILYIGLGTPEFILKVSYADLNKLNNAKVVDVCEIDQDSGTKKRILTGDRPTGKMHIGHLFGTLLNRVKLQDEYEQFLIMANIHALSDNADNPMKVREGILELMCDYYAVGIDFAKSTPYIQSEVPEVHEIFMYLANFATVQQLNHNPTLKTELKQNGMEGSTPLGFYLYPVHQAADILCVNADLVPVGIDQAPMVEDTRELARKFNSMYKVNLLNQPQAMFGVEVNVPGIDGNAKMGKSLGNGIYLADSEDDLRNKVRKIYTDPSRIHATDPGNIEGNVAFAYHDLFNENLDEVADLKARYIAGKVGDVEVKEKLFNAMNVKLTPIRERRVAAESRKNEFLDIAMEGSKKVRSIARGIADQMKEAMKIKF
jgi:tryptophanyl-tRNA synthetase